MARKRVPMYGIGFVAYFFVIFHRSSAAVMAPDIVSEFAVGPAAAGLLGAVFMYGYALMNLPGGMLADSVGPRKTLSGAFMLAAMGSLLFGVAQDYNVALIGRVLVAIGGACVFTSINKLFVEWSSKKRFATLSGSLLSLGRLGAVVATAPLAFLLITVGWRGSFIYIGLISAVIAIAAYLIIRDKPGDCGLPPPDRQVVPEPKPKVKTPAASPFKGLGEVVSKPQLWLLLVFATSIVGTANAVLATWGGLFFEEALGFNKTMSASILLVAGVAGLFGGITSGFISDKMFSKKTVAAVGGIIFLILWGILAFRVADLSLWMLYLIIGFVGLGEIWCVTATFALARIMFPARVIGTTIGWINFICWAAGAGFFAQVWGYFVKGTAVIAPYTTGAFQSAFIFQWFVLAIGLLALIFVKEQPIKMGEEVKL